jgi:hypothetical protein
MSAAKGSRIETLGTNTIIYYLVGVDLDNQPQQRQETTRTPQQHQQRHSVLYASTAEHGLIGPVVEIG